MEENFAFWFREFRYAPASSTDQAPSAIHFFEALALAIEVFDPGREIKADDIRNWFNNAGFEPESLDKYSRDRGWFETVLEKFKEMNLPEKGGFDIVAIIYEFTGEIYPGGAIAAPFLSDELKFQIQKYRLVYPSAQIAAITMSIDAKFAYWTEKQEAFLKSIKIIANNEKTKISENISNIINNADRLLKNTFETAKNNVILEIDDEKTKFLKEIDDKLENIKEEVLKDSQEEIEKYKREAGATLVVNNAHTLWSDKAKDHRKIFIWSAISFVAVMLVAIALPVWNWSLISTEILKLEPLFNGHVFGAVVLLLIPVLGVAWVLRLLSRFTTQNMMLADDAQMRRVMAETYVKLVSEGAIEDPADRAIILSALFRPLPGSNTEDVSPPSITDILKAK